MIRNFCEFICLTLIAQCIHCFDMNLFQACKCTSFFQWNRNFYHCITCSTYLCTYSSRIHFCIIITVYANFFHTNCRIIRFAVFFIHIFRSNFYCNICIIIITKIIFFYCISRNQRHFRNFRCCTVPIYSNNSSF